MIEKLTEHYSFTNPASVYDEEPLTALELVGRLANKIKEVIELVNKNELTVEEGYKYLVDNLPDNVEKAVEKLKNSGELETILVKAVSNGKVDKNGVSQITYAMLSQDVREMFTGGNTAVVGNDSVSTTNIVDNSISESKLHRNIIECGFYSPAEKGYMTPLLIVNTSTHTVVKNPDYNSEIRLNTRENAYQVNVSTLVIDATEWTTSNLDFYYNHTSGIIKVVNGGTRSTAFAQWLYLGGVYSNGLVSTTIIPVEVDSNFYGANQSPSQLQMPLTMLTPSLYHQSLYNYKDTSALFDFDFSTCTGKPLVTGSYVVSVEGKAYTINFETAQFVVNFTSTGASCGLWYNPLTNTFLFDKVSSVLRNKGNHLYLGVVTNAGASAGSTCVLPYTINNGTHYMHPNTKNRPQVKLMMNNTQATGHKIVPKIDFKNRQMIIPSGTALYYVWDNDFLAVNGLDLTKDIVIPFDESNSNYQYLVGGKNGLKFLNYTDFTSPDKIRDINSLYYFGFINIGNQDIQIGIEAEKMKTVSILGDSVSTFYGMIPTGNQNFYTVGRYGVDSYHETWWGRVLDRCGLSLLVNDSWSGALVSETSEKGFLTRARKLSDADMNDPDIIFLFGGYNDFTNNVSPEAFRQAYTNVLHSMNAMYVNNTRIF